MSPTTGRIEHLPGRNVAADIETFRRRYPQWFGTVHATRMLAAWGGAALVLAVVSMWVLDFSFTRIISGWGRLFDFLALMLPPSTNGKAMIYIQAMFETLGMAFLGTLCAAILAFPFAFLAAKNVIPNIFAHFAARRSLDFIRGVDVLIWALLWVNVVGLGPFAGVLAIACSDTGSFGKLFSEAIENTDRRPVEGVMSSGGNRWQVMRFAILPQVWPVIGSQVLYFFESNTRAATILGIVGAGGIGIYLTDQLRTLNFPVVTFLVGLILVAVILIDFVSGYLRRALIGKTSVNREL